MIVFSRRQVLALPVEEASAITIHKSLGMTLPAAVVHLGSLKKFEPKSNFKRHAVYEALSRCERLDQMSVKGFEPSLIFVDPEAEEAMALLEEHSVSKAFANHLLQLLESLSKGSSKEMAGDGLRLAPLWDCLRRQTRTAGQTPEKVVDAQDTPVAEGADVDDCNWQEIDDDEMAAAPGEGEEVEVEVGAPAPTAGTSAASQQDQEHLYDGEVHADPLLHGTAADKVADLTSMEVDPPRVAVPVAKKAVALQLPGSFTAVHKPSAKTPVGKKLYTVTMAWNEQMQPGCKLTFHVPPLGKSVTTTLTEEPNAGNLTLQLQMPDTVTDDSFPLGKCHLVPAAQPSVVAAQPPGAAAVVAPSLTKAAPLPGKKKRATADGGVEEEKPAKKTKKKDAQPPLSDVVERSREEATSSPTALKAQAKRDAEGRTAVPSCVQPPIPDALAQLGALGWRLGKAEGKGDCSVLSMMAGHEIKDEAQVRHPSTDALKLVQKARDAGVSIVVGTQPIGGIDAKKFRAQEGLRRTPQAAAKEMKGWRSNRHWCADNAHESAAFLFGVSAHLGRPTIVLEQGGGGILNPCRVYAARGEDGSLHKSKSKLLSWFPITFAEVLTTLKKDPSAYSVLLHDGDTHFDPLLHGTAADKVADLTSMQVPVAKKAVALQLAAVVAPPLTKAALPVATAVPLPGNKPPAAASTQLPSVASTQSHAATASTTQPPSVTSTQSHTAAASTQSHAAASMQVKPSICIPSFPLSYSSSPRLLTRALTPPPSPHPPSLSLLPLSLLPHPVSSLSRPPPYSLSSYSPSCFGLRT